MDLQALSDKIEIGEALARYARAVDTRDWDLWKSVFTSDAHIDYRSAAGRLAPATRSPTGSATRSHRSP